MIAVRHARAGDAAGILACLAEACEPFRHEYSEAAFADTVLDPESLQARMGAMTVFVAERDGRIVGTIAARADVEDGHLRGMAVLPSAQGGGVGRRLLRRALDELTVAGCRRVTLDTTAPLTRAQRFYESAGFRRTGRVSDFFAMPLYELAAPSNAAFSFRVAAPQDAPAIRRVVNAAYLVEREFVSGERLGESELRHCLETGMFLVAVSGDGPPSASVFLRPLGGRRTYLGLLAVDPSQQRRGLGALLMAAAERLCRARNDEAIDIRVVNLRPELPPFYRGRGFVETGAEPFEDPRLFKPAHFVTMTLAL
jgi:GNAT superfamily N-acetyltransferase